MSLLDMHDLPFDLARRVDPVILAQPCIAQAYALIVGRFSLGDVEELRAIMQASNCVISGLYALHAFFCNGFQPGDLDLYVPSLTSAPLLRFIQLCGYHCFHTTVDYSTHTTCIAKVDHFRLPSTSLKIDIVYSCTASLIQVIPHFHSTIVMNYLTWYGAVLFYPRLTLNKWAS